jgi:glycosyl transferase family 87
MTAIALAAITQRAFNFRDVIWLVSTGLGLALWLAYIVWAPIAIDAHAYFAGQYGQLGGVDSYLYSPAFSQVIEPLRWLGWDGFRTAWRALDVGALAIFAGPLTGPLLFVSPVALEVNLGNIHLLLAAAVVAGFRWPATWAFVLLTKVTPGVGLLWFVFRREWRSLAIALGATATIAGVSFALDPSAWIKWVSVLASPGEVEGELMVISAPLVWRLPFAVGLVWWGARRNYRWSVLVAAFVALPAVWLFACAMMIGLPAIVRGTPKTP